MRNVGRLVTCDIERLEAYGREHGVAALLDRLGLDGFGNEVVELQKEVARLRRALERIAEPLSMARTEDTALVQIEVAEIARTALNGDPDA